MLRRASLPIDRAALMRNVRELLAILRQDTDDPGLSDTPRRVADAWIEFLEHDPGTVDTTFEAVSVDQMVVVRDMPLTSLCEHHLMPFTCTVAVGYIARDRVLGLSKIGRVAVAHAHRLQLQERLVRDIAAEVSVLAGTPDVAVVARGEHGCMAGRGVRLPHVMLSSETRGLFRADPAARAEFMRLALG